MATHTDVRENGSTESEELLHALRNVAFAMQCSLDRLREAQGSGADDDFADAYAAMRKQLDALRDALKKAERFAER